MAQSHTQAGLQLYQSAGQAEAHSAEQAVASRAPQQATFGGLVLVEMTIESLLMLAFLFALVLAFSSVLLSSSGGATCVT